MTKLNQRIEKSTFFSVVIPLYNKEQYIKRALHSVLAQTFKYFEIIIVNDGSTDKGPELVRQINDPRLRMIDQQNAGVSAARNRGIAEAGADYIAFLDADDEWQSTFLSTICGLIERYPHAGLYATSYYFADAEGNQWPADIRGLPRELTWHGIIKNYFKVANMGDPPIWTSAVCLPKKVFEAVGLFPIGIKCGEDLDMWTRVAIKYPVAFSRKPEAMYYRGVQGSAAVRYFGYDKHCDYIHWLTYDPEYAFKPDLKKYAIRKQFGLVRKAILADDLTFAKQALISITGRTKYSYKWLVLRVCSWLPMWAVKLVNSLRCRALGKKGDISRGNTSGSAYLEK